MPRVPTVSLETLCNVFRIGQAGSASERNVVLVVQKDQFAESQMSRERSGFMADAFHQIAIAADAVRVMVDDGVARPVKPRGKPGFRNRQTNRVPKTLAERPRRDFHAHRMAALRMPRRFAPPLPEMLQLVQRKIIARQIQQAVEQ